MRRVYESILAFFERQTFGVCAWLGDLLKMKTASIRLFFIYSSFFAFGSPIVLYFIIAFWLNLRNLIRSRRSRIWDL